MDAIFAFLKQIIESSGMQYEFVAQIFMVIGMLRIVFKPLMGLIESVIKVTPSQSDDAFLAKLMGNKIYQVFAYILDWAASIKLPIKK